MTVSNTPQSVQSAASGSPANVKANGFTGVYVPRDWGQFWRPKLIAALAGTGKASIGVLGDSTSSGWHFTSAWTKGWPGLLAAALQGAPGSASDGGSGYIGVANSQLYNAANGFSQWATYHASDPHAAALTSGWALGGSYIGPGMLNIQSNTAGDTATFTVRGQSITIFFINQTSGAPMNVTVDGVAPTAGANGLSGTGVSTTGTALLPGSVTFTGYSKGNHTVLVTNATSGSPYLILCGASGENPTGVIVNDFSAGSRTSAIAAATNVANWSGGPAYPTPNDLFLYAMAINDTAGSVPQGTRLANVIAAMNQVKTAAALAHIPDVGFVFPTIGNDSTTLLSFFAQYMALAQSLAASYGAALFNVQAAGGGTSAFLANLGYFGGLTADGAAGSDSTHPSDAGHQYIYNLLGPVLTAVA